MIRDSKKHFSITSKLQENFCAKLIANRPLLREKFSNNLCYEIEHIMKPVLFEISDEVVNILNNMNHGLILDEEYDANLLNFRYIHIPPGYCSADDYEFLLAFDLSVSVFFAQNKPGGARKEASLPSRDNIMQDISGYFSKHAFLSKKKDKVALEELCNKLQNIIEFRMCEFFKPTINTIVSGLNTAGHSLENLKSVIPEIDFNDSYSGLHIGFYCIATVDFAL